jgi:hypothetical protein
MKTDRGFELTHFKDDYGVDCTLQESSAWEPHIWLGIDKPEVSIMYKDLESSDFTVLGSDMSCSVYVNLKDSESTHEGWCKYPIPDKSLIASRMHINQVQAKALAELLNYFAEHGTLPNLNESISLDNFTLIQE